MKASAEITYSPYAIEIVDLDNNQNVKECRTGMVCSVAIPQSVAGTYTYVALISVPYTGYPPPQVPVAKSPFLAVVWVANCAPTNSCNPTSFADDIFVYPGIAAPVTAANEYAMRVWERTEGGGAGCPGQPSQSAPWAYSTGPAGNPINTTQREPGSTDWNSVPVQIYHNSAGQTCCYWGIKANADTLQNGYYPPILKVLRNPAADSHTQCVLLGQAVGSTKWGTPNFSGNC